MNDEWTGQPDSRWFVRQMSDRSDDLGYMASAVVYGGPSKTKPATTPYVDWYDRNGENQWTNDPSRRVVQWRISGKDGWRQAWDHDPGQWDGTPNQAFITNEGYLEFGYIEDDDARQGWHTARIRAWKDGKSSDFSSAPSSTAEPQRSRSPLARRRARF